MLVTNLVLVGDCCTAKLATSNNFPPPPFIVITDVDLKRFFAVVTEEEEEEAAFGSTKRDAAVMGATGEGDDNIQQNVVDAVVARIRRTMTKTLLVLRMFRL